MRTVSKAGLGSIAALALFVGGGASAQRVVSHGPGASYPMPGSMGASPAPPPPMTRPAPPPPMMVRPAPMAGRPGASRWGSQVDGRWSGGINAPGGYAAYRRPYRGWALPTYWVSPRFYLTDWRDYGLAQPPIGHRWVRYYDDAVLIDARGSVYDSRGGIDWDGRDDGYAGGMIYDEGRGPGPRGYDEDYPPSAGFVQRSPSSWVSPDGVTTVTTTGAGHGGGTTVVTVQSQPVVTTTTTTEVYDDRVTYTPRRTRHVYRTKYVRRSPTKSLRR